MNVTDGCQIRATSPKSRTPRAVAGSSQDVVPGATARAWRPAGAVDCLPSDVLMSVPSLPVPFDGVLRRPPAAA